MKLFKKNNQKQMELHNSSTGETPKAPEQVNHPAHYNQYPIEVIDMMIVVFGKEATFYFCLLNAFKYRMRAGNKQNLQEDLDKEAFYLDKAKKLDKKGEYTEKYREFYNKLY
jgi:hypothetical protein